MKIIINGEAVEVGGGGPGGESLDVYSTEEKRIGTWIDGKPLYRKTVSANSTTGSWHTVVPDFIPGYSLLVSLFGTVEANMSEGKYFPLPYSSDMSFGVNSSGGLQVNAANQAWYNKNLIVTAIYTKTTDEPETTT